MSEVIENAVIQSVELFCEDHDILTAYVNVKIKHGVFCGFGGYNLNPSDPFKGCASYFIKRVLEICGATHWDKLVGKVIRVKHNGDCGAFQIDSIGHPIEDKWFTPKEEFKTRTLGK